MIKRYFPLLILIVTITTYFLLNKTSKETKIENINNKSESTPTTNPIPSQVPSPEVSTPLPTPQVLKERKLIGISLPPEKVKPVNVVTKDWQEKLENNLKIQGGDALKEVKIQKIDSVIINRDGNAVNAESVVIILKNQKGEISKFRAMIDSQTGKILETWDRPVTDPMNPREDFRLKLDPRHNN